MTRQEDLLTLAEIATFLKVSKKTIFRMNKDGRLKGFKVGNQWRFVRPVVDDWILDRMSHLPNKNLVGIIKTAEKIIPLTELIPSDHILLNIEKADKRGILSQLVVPLEKNGLIEDREYFIKRLLAREEIMSTAIGHGVAMPHMRNPLENKVLKPTMVLGICSEGVDYDALDEEKTHVFALIATNSELIHIRLLAEISLFFKQDKIVEKLCSVQSKKDVIKYLKDADITISVGI